MRYLFAALAAAVAFPIGVAIGHQVHPSTVTVQKVKLLQPTAKWRADRIVGMFRNLEPLAVENNGGVQCRTYLHKATPPTWSFQLCVLTASPSG